MLSAQYNLARMYYTGSGTTKSYKKALSLFQNAADQGFAFAQSNLGAMYANGDGVNAENIQAYMWLSLAIDGGAKTALDNLKSIEVKMTSEQIEKEGACQEVAD